MLPLIAVEVLEKELIESDAMLLLNNAGPSKAAFAFTRHFVGWSMGVCLIAHSNSKNAIPEIEHGKNALLGETDKDIAAFIAQVTANRALNESLRRGGRETYEMNFTPWLVAGR